jgi:DNA-binding NarL/FixJ family response regulator
VEVVGTATDREEAVALAVELRPDAVVMDLVMLSLRRRRCDPAPARTRPDIKISR